MAFQQTVQVTGDTDSYSISPSIKKYALKDVGFLETKSGNFQLERSLDPSSPYNKGFQLKVTVAKSLDGFKMATTTANGLKDVNLFKDAANADFVEQYHYILQNLLDREILVKA